MSFPLPSASASQSQGSSADNEDTPQQKVAPGVVLDKNGKPCRTCTSVSAWMAMAKSAGGTKPKPAPVSTRSDCPPDVEELGRSSWTLLHSVAATYPERADAGTQSVMKQFISTFSKLYPCYVCAEDFQDWMKEPTNNPQVGGQDELGLWACRAHNAVNVKLGKPEFDCNLWKQRWRDGWKDGRCD